MNLTSCAPATTDTASNKNSIGRLATTDDCMVLCRITRVRRSHEMPSLMVQQIWQPRCFGRRIRGTLGKERNNWSPLCRRRSA